MISKLSNKREILTKIFLIRILIPPNRNSSLMMIFTLMHSAAFLCPSIGVKDISGTSEEGQLYVFLSRLMLLILIWQLVRFRAKFQKISDALNQTISD